jgi:hypothetical protein
MPPTTAAPQPKNTKAKVPMNSAIEFFILLSTPVLRGFFYSPEPVTAIAPGSTSALAFDAHDVQGKFAERL